LRDLCFLIAVPVERYNPVSGRTEKDQPIPPNTENLHDPRACIIVVNNLKDPVTRESRSSGHSFLKNDWPFAVLISITTRYQSARDPAGWALSFEGGVPAKEAPGTSAALRESEAPDVDLYPATFAAA
jgi:hypothetical protein